MIVMATAGLAAAESNEASDLQKMLEDVRRKEKQAQSSDDARTAIIAEIAKMSDEERRLKLAASLSAYREIAGSEHGKAHAQKAWDHLLSQWGMAPGTVLCDNSKALAELVTPGHDPDSSVPRPPWASDFGKDNCGIWASVKIGTQTQVFRYIPPGKYEQTRRERKERTVIISRPFWLADSEVTQAIWVYVMKVNPSHFKGDELRPVESVSWIENQVFCKRFNDLVPGISVGLPSAAQWEYASRADSRPEDQELSNYMWYSGNAKRTTHPVKTKKCNEFGLYDMYGNVWEWCADWSGNEEMETSETQRDPRGPTAGESRTYRGGCYKNTAKDTLYRTGDEPKLQADYLGFRLAAPVSP